MQVSFRRLFASESVFYHCLSIGDLILTFVPVLITLLFASFTEGPFARVLSKVERGRSLRAALRTAPGRLRASVTPVLRPVREVQSLDWDRWRRVTPAEATSQEAWPGVEPANLRVTGESRGEAPEGERPPQRTRRTRWCG
jgi:hypothetical protein